MGARATSARYGEGFEVHLSAEQFEEMSVHLRAAYPDEGCGLIVGPPPGGAADGVERMRLIPCRNMQNEMHARDPESYPRTARRAFLIDPFEMERILQKAKKGGEVLRGIFHSHPDEDAYFSQEDKDAAVPFGDIPSFPEVEHIVVSVRKGEVREGKSFFWDPDQKDFAEGRAIALKEEPRLEEEPR